MSPQVAAPQLDPRYLSSSNGAKADTRSVEVSIPHPYFIVYLTSDRRAAQRALVRMIYGVLIYIADTLEDIFWPRRKSAARAEKVCACNILLVAVR